MEIKNKYTLTVLIQCATLLVPGLLYAQQGETLLRAGNYYAPLGSDSYHLIDRIDIQNFNTYQYMHTSAKPYLRNEIAGLVNTYGSYGEFSHADSFNLDYLVADNSEFFTHHRGPYYQGDIFDFFYAETPSAFYKFFTIKINPVIHADIGSSSDTSGVRFLNTRGIELRGSIDDKVGFYLYAADNQAKFPAYVQEHIAATNRVVPGDGVSKIFKETGSDFSSTHGYIGFNATEHIAIQFGQDKIFIGDGIRSMIWSDNAKDFLFLKINTHIWRINYQNVFAELANFDGSNIYNSLVHKKYAAMHHLSVNVVKDLNLGVFETVVFDRTNTAGNAQGFEFYYLNPVIFYRAVESGLGSSDNVVLGANWKWNFLDRFSFYGQFVLDELVFDELFSGDGWWGNKYAAQAGLKYINAFSIPNLDLQYEHNLARPYTYSYEDENGSSYTHYGQAIAHPLGANFREHIFSLWYQPFPKIVISNQLIAATYGSDTSGSNWGGSIFLDYNLYEQPYGNTIGQGIANNLLLNDLVVSWQVWHNTYIDGRVIYRNVDSEIETLNRKETYFSIGIRMNDPLRRWFF